jgi:flagellar biosynthesis protein FlhB
VVVVVVVVVVVAVVDCSYKKEKYFNEVNTTKCEQKASNKGNYLLIYSRG